MEDELLIVVTGSRWYGKAGVVARVLSEYSQANVRILHGACSRIVKGEEVSADMLADKAARNLGYQVEGHPADWTAHGAAAGPKRNEEKLIARNPHLVIAFGTGKGTDGCVELAQQAGLNVRREP